MRESEADRSVEMSVTEYECELISAFREIRDGEVAQMIGELVHVLSISHMADVIPLTRKSVDHLSVAGGIDAPCAAKASAPRLLDLLDA